MMLEQLVIIMIAVFAIIFIVQVYGSRHFALFMLLYVVSVSSLYALFRHTQSGYVFIGLIALLFVKPVAGLFRRKPANN